MDRRRFLKTAAVAGSGLAVFGSLESLGPVRAADGPYGALGPSDPNGMRLPSGFSSRVVATTGHEVAGTGYRWHPNPDGGATFPALDGGWIYVSNNEAEGRAGGTSMVRFDGTGTVIDAKSILSGTSRNCGGGPTPWGTWLSCEEVGAGRVWECDPMGLTAPAVRPAMGTFRHEAAAADEIRQVIYLTEDRPDGALYRFVPDTWGDLSAGHLEVLTEDGPNIGWFGVPDPSASNTPTRYQISNSKVFNGGEGAWFDGIDLYFTTKGDNRVWRYDPAANRLTVIYHSATSLNPVLRGVDGVTLSPFGDIYVCEDGGNMEVVLLTQDGTVAPFLRLAAGGSELTGVAFDPSGTRLYVSSQRNPGRTYEIFGPFRLPATAVDAVVVVDGVSKRQRIDGTAVVTVTDAGGAPAVADVEAVWFVNDELIAVAGGRTADDGSLTVTRDRIAMSLGDVLTLTVMTVSGAELRWDPDMFPGVSSGSWTNDTTGGGGKGRGTVGRKLPR